LTGLGKGREKKRKGAQKSAIGKKGGGEKPIPPLGRPHVSITYTREKRKKKKGGACRVRIIKRRKEGGKGKEKNPLFVSAGKTFDFYHPLGRGRKREGLKNPSKKVPGSLCEIRGEKTSSHLTCLFPREDAERGRKKRGS